MNIGPKTREDNGKSKSDTTVDVMSAIGITGLPLALPVSPGRVTISRHLSKSIFIAFRNCFTSSKRPKPINVTSVTYNLETMTVQWDSSNELDFKEYILYYSESRTGTKQPIKTYNNIVNTKYETTDFNPLKENWYFMGK